jgi:chromosome segregation ATPase
MSEELLEAIIEKLENLERRIHALEEKIDSVTNYSEDFRSIRGDMREIRMEVKSIPSQISIPEDEIKEARLTMSSLKNQLKKPLQQKIKTIHYLSKPLLLSIGLMILIVGLITWLVLEKNRESTM